MRSEARKKSQARFDAQNTKRYTLKLNKRTNAELIELLDSVESQQGLIKQALREYIENHAERGEV